MDKKAFGLENKVGLSIISIMIWIYVFKRKKIATYVATIQYYPILSSESSTILNNIKSFK